jgi:hypothetical protein
MIGAATIELLQDGSLASRQNGYDVGVSDLATRRRNWY